MGGVFGGLLQLLNLIGGAFLWIWFGHKAWLDGPIPRLCRLGVAAYLVGIIAGLVEYKYGGPFMGPFEFQMIMILFQFPFLALVLVGALEGIRWILEWTDKKPKER